MSFNKVVVEEILHRFVEDLVKCQREINQAMSAFGVSDHKNLKWRMSPEWAALEARIIAEAPDFHAEAAAAGFDLHAWMMNHLKEVLERVNLKASTPED